MLGNQLIGLGVEFLFAMGRSLKRCCSRKDSKDVALWEKDHELNDFDSTTLISEYLDLVIQFGFVTLFVVAFPFVFFARCSSPDSSLFSSLDWHRFSR